MPPTDEKLPPHDPDAERAVLGGCLIDPDALARVGSIVRPEDFYNAGNRAMFAAMLALHREGAPVDHLTLYDKMTEQGHTVNVSALAKLVEDTPTSLHVVHHARIVERLATRRRLMDAAAVTTAEAFDLGLDVDEIQENAVKRAMEAGSRQKRQPRPMSELVSAYFDRMEALAANGKPPGLPTGFADIDAILGGMQRSDMLILAARPSVGKTSLALCVALNAAKRFGGHVGFFSLEMSNDQVVERLVSMDSGVGTESLRKGDLMESEWAAFHRAVDEIGKLPIHVDDTPGLSPVELRMKASTLHAAVGLDLVVVDYLQLMKTYRKFRDLRHEVTAISGDLKALARDLDLPVLALSHLSRACESRLDKRPRLSDLRESGALEQDADVVMFVYRDEMYDPNTETPNLAEVNVTKHRKGRTGTASLFFKKELTQFLDVEIHRQDLNGNAYRQHYTETL